MSHIERPTKITATLKIIEAEFPADVIAALETYIEALEANQASENMGMALSKSSIPPVWSHQRVREREEHMRERALKKLNNYR